MQRGFGSRGAGRGGGHSSNSGYGHYTSSQSPSSAGTGRAVEGGWRGRGRGHMGEHRDYSQSPFSKTVEVRSEDAGLVIGKRGAMCRRMGEYFDVTIQSPKDRGPIVKFVVRGKNELTVNAAATEIQEVAMKRQITLFLHSGVRRHMEAKKEKLEEIKRDNEVDIILEEHPCDPTKAAVKIRSPEMPNNVIATVHLRTLFHIPETDVPLPERFLFNASEAGRQFVEALVAKRRAPGSPAFDVLRVYEIVNAQAQLRLNQAVQDWTLENKKKPDMLVGFHGTPTKNILPIITDGFSSEAWKRAAYGAGNYFAKDPSVSIGYCGRDGNALLVCQIILGDPKKDHEWVEEKGYYVIPDPRRIQPLYVIVFKNGQPEDDLENLESKAFSDEYREKRRLTEGTSEPGRHNRRFTMELPETTELFVGFLDPHKNVLQLEADVKNHLRGVPVQKIEICTEGLRRYANVTLSKPLLRSEVQLLNDRKYLGAYDIAVDDIQPAHPAFNKLCPRMSGPSASCRFANIRHAGRPCPFRHPPRADVCFYASYETFEVGLKTAKGDEIVTDFMKTATEFSIKPPGRPAVKVIPSVIAIRQIFNSTRDMLYEKKKEYYTQKNGALPQEMELYHGTTCDPDVMREIYEKGLTVPSDCKPSPNCPRMKGKKLSTTLCNNECKYCVERHEKSNCHMYGLGLYFADKACKSHRYISNPQLEDPKNPGSRLVFKMILCRVNLGQVATIDTLKDADAMHDVAAPTPYSMVHFHSTGSRQMEHVDSFKAVGKGERALKNLEVINNEYIVFNPIQALPLYEISYVVNEH